MDFKETRRLRGHVGAVMRGRADMEDRWSRGTARQPELQQMQGRADMEERWVILTQTVRERGSTVPNFRLRYDLTAGSEGPW